MPEQDETFMRIALECAVEGLGAVEPNPMVGAVIVVGGKEIARTPRTIRRPARGDRGDARGGGTPKSGKKGTGTDFVV